jgi:capsid assembly protease
MIRALPHILARVFNVPLLIQPTRLEALLAGLNAAMLREPVARGLDPRGGSAETSPHLADPASDAPNGGQRPRGYSIDRGVATLPVRGVLVRRAGQIDADSTPLQSYESLTRVLRAARADSRVRGILLELDSPGGEAGGVFDFAAEIRRTAQLKPVWAIANDDALSAAYALAAGAERIWITDTGAAGSIGVVALHLDRSRFDAENGFAYTYVYKGAHKIDANPHLPLTAEARGQVQGEVDRLYDMLISSIAGHRRLAPEQLRATEAAIYFGDNARDAGLVDQVGTLDQAHAALAERVSLNSRRGTAGMTSEQIEIEIESRTGDNIVNLDEVRATAIAATRETAGEIAALCALAGYPEIAAEQIRAGASIDGVRQLLQARQAADAAARHVETIDTTTAGRHGGGIGAALAEAAAARFAAQAKATGGSA